MQNESTNKYTITTHLSRVRPGSRVGVDDNVAKIELYVTSHASPAEEIYIISCQIYYYPNVLTATICLVLLIIKSRKSSNGF